MSRTSLEVGRAIVRDVLANPPASAGALRETLAVAIARDAPFLDDAESLAVLAACLRDLEGFGPLEPLLGDATVSEIMVNGPGRVFVERAGRLEAVPLDLDAASIEAIAQRVVAPLGLRLDRAAPIVDARLPDGSRVHAVLPPVAPDGPMLTVRRFAPRVLRLTDFDVPVPVADLVDGLLESDANVLVAGATSSGKTTLLNALAARLDPRLRILTIEETAELRLDLPHVVRLEARRANAEGAGATTVRELVHAALRMRPDRIVVGEVRGAEALDMLQAINTGHDGSLCTIHANSALDALVRLETLAMFAASGLPLVAIRRQIVHAVDAVVFVRRAANGHRVVHEVAEVVEDLAAAADVRTRTLAARPDGDGSLRVVAAPARRKRRPC